MWSAKGSSSTASLWASICQGKGELALKMNIGLTGNSALQQPLPFDPNWLGVESVDRYGLQPASSWPFVGSSNAGFSFVNTANQIMIPKGWRSGDWVCDCGFHNYSSRAQCKKCNASLPSSTLSSLENSANTDLFPAHGSKRLASEEFVSDWDNKRLNAGYMNSLMGQSGNDQQRRGYVPYQSESMAMMSGVQLQMQLQQLPSSNSAYTFRKRGKTVA